MPLDSIRPPAKFPPHFHLHLRQAEGSFPLASYPSLEEARREARRWRAFIKSLREFPRHESALALGDWSARTSIHLLPSGQWELAIVYRPSMAAALEAALASSKD